MLEKTRSRNKLTKQRKTDYDYLSRLAELGCLICSSPANIHHLRTGKGMAQRSDDYHAIPLCHFHHQGNQGIHTLGTKAWQAKYGTELELLEKVRKMLK